MKTAPSRKPASSIHVVPVISPLPLRENQPANTGSLDALPRGRIAVTPVRTGPAPTFRGPSPATSVVMPTSTPGTSVIAFRDPGVPSKGTPRSRARGRSWAAGACENATNPAMQTARDRRKCNVIARRILRARLLGAPAAVRQHEPPVRDRRIVDPQHLDAALFDNARLPRDDRTVPRPREN